MLIKQGVVMSRSYLLPVIAALLCPLAAGARADDIRIGFTGPITGPAAFLGQQMKWGAELAEEEINNHGGVLGRKLAVEMQDSQCRPADALSAAEKLLSQDKVDLLLGDLCSGATMALMPVAEKARRPMIVSISTLPEITAKAGIGGNAWVFRTVPTDSMMAGVAAQKLAAAKIKTIAFFAEDTDYGRASIALLKAQLGPDIQIVSEDYVKPTEADFLSILTKLRSSKPEAIAVFTLDQQGANFMKQAAQFGLTMPLVGRPPLMAAQAKDLIASGKFDGSWTVYPYYDQDHTPENDAFVAAFTAKAKQGPHYVAYGIYESILVAADAIRRAGTTEPAALRDALASTSYRGILGPIAFDANNQAHNSMMYLVVEQGKLGVKELIAAH
jgi:branched-chain amino acid transport system substrate-binding protein